MHLSKLSQSLSKRLMRQTQTTASRWSEQVMVMGEPFPGPFSFRYHPWTREMLDSETDLNVGKKAAQMGYSVTLLNRSLFLIDIRKESVLYLLPTKTPDATDFSSTRFDPLLESSEHLQDLFSDVKNVGTKRAGLACLYLRGSNSRASLKSIPVSTIMFDEFDEMVAKNIPLARERISGQRHSQEWMVSTPTLPGLGIDAEYQRSTQQVFHFRCPCCSRLISLYHENLIINEDSPELSYIACGDCNKPITEPGESQDSLTERKASWYEAGSEWVAGKSKGHGDGWYVNQLYSCASAGHPAKLAQSYLYSLTNKATEQEYHNSKMGMAHEVEGARITEEMIIKSIDPGLVKQPSALPNRIITMGVDVGAKLHIEIDAWEITATPSDNDINNAAKPIVIYEGTRSTTAGFHELDALMRDYNVRMCVIDANPERSSALAFARRFWGWVRLCFYNRGISSTSLSETDSDDHKVAVDRTLWLDVSLGRFLANRITLPRDVSLEYRRHLQNIARIYEEDSDGNPVGKYLNNGDDHFAHARNYAEIALPLAVGYTKNQTILS